MCIDVQVRPKVLSVDDSPTVQELIKRALSDDYQVLLCQSAIDALSMINQEEISVLLLDISMPEIDGLDFCRTIRSIPKFQDLPIIMVTGRDRAFDKVQGRIAGATDYLTKPFDAEQLRQVMRKLISTHALPH
ncbi:response regulator [Phormidium sp. CLA17]|uniref:response regulator n=1 Tax=Leptolyngbya sp. Cla-17 TaxID=2803751 RepID=UPI0014919FAB|nr:response regulator [Leptolyngbya sp. Cla-17]MBM0744622.1 response regulator [Leptolyngbya sp. Cla-17]